jgi:zeta-carotene isomerase
VGSRGCIVAKASSRGDVEKTAPSLEFGEDAAAFDVSEQNVTSWALFFTLLTGVLGLIYVLWIDPSYGVGSSFTGLIESLAPTSEIAILEILFVFAVMHSGLAYLRPYGEDLIGARAYRVVFALISLPLAIAAVVFFINHRYDGIALWNIRGIPGVHEAVWIASFISFYFLYPSTFNILIMEPLHCFVRVFMGGVMLRASFWQMEQILPSRQKMA